MCEPLGDEFMQRWLVWSSCFTVFVLGATALSADDAEAIARGKKAVETRAFSPPPWSFKAYESVWKQWQPPLDKPPPNYDQAFREHYGLHPAPFDNGRYPMGLRSAQFLVLQGLTTDCLVCHGGSILGKSYIGLGNASLDIQGFFEDLDRASGRAGKLPHTFTNVRGTSEAGAMAVFLHSLRNPDLSLRLKRQQ